MKTNIQKRICPACGQEYTGYPAISRKDNKTEICSLCGTREALEAMGISKEEQEKILAIVQQGGAYVENGSDKL